MRDLEGRRRTGRTPPRTPQRGRSVAAESASERMASRFHLERGKTAASSDARRNYLMQLPAMTRSVSRVASYTTHGNLGSRVVTSLLSSGAHQSGAEHMSCLVI